MTQIKLIIMLIMVLTFGCGKRSTIRIENEAKETTTTYQAYALLHFKGGEGPDSLLSNQLKKLGTETFQERITNRFLILWGEMKYPAPEDDQPAVPGKYSFSPNGGFVTLTAEATSPELAILTANAVAQSAESFFMEEARRKSEESVAWLKNETEKQKELLSKIDQEIQGIQSQMGKDDQLQALLKRRVVQSKIINNIQDSIKEERMQYDQNAVLVRIVEHAEKAYAR